MSEESRVAVVTGAGRPGGIGLATARALLADGWSVVVSDVPAPPERAPEYPTASSAELEEAVASLGHAERTAAHPVDVADADQVEALAEVALRRFGRLDGWINNAGLTVGFGPFAEITDEAWRLSLDVMATGTFNGCRAAIRRLGSGGRIVNVASQGGKVGYPLFAAYCAAKFAVIGLTQSLAAEVGERGITVNSVCPGTVDTPLLEVPGGVWATMAETHGTTVDAFRSRAMRGIPIRRMVSPEEVASAIAYLCSPAASGITGAALNVTGGEVMH